MKPTRTINLSRAVCACPRCGEESKRHSVSSRNLAEIGVTAPALLRVVYSKHFCRTCRKFFCAPMDHIARPSSRYSLRVMRSAVALVESGATLGEAAQAMRSRYHVRVPVTTLHLWVSDVASVINV